MIGHHRHGIPNRWTLFSEMAEIIPFKDPLLAKEYASYMVMTLICSGWGLLAMAGWRRQSQRKANLGPSAFEPVQQESTQ
jgi:hypothetical protein